MRLPILFLLVSGCGSGTTSLLALEIKSSDGAPSLQSADVFLLRETSTAGEALSCETLGDNWRVLRSDTVVLLQKIISASAPHLDDIPPEQSSIVAVDGYATTDGTGPRIGFGCADHVTIKGGQRTTLTIDLQAF